MARVRLDEIIDNLENEVRQALEDAVNRVMPGANFNSHNLFREFVRAVERRCNIWENVPDGYVEKD